MPSGGLGCALYSWIQTPSFAFYLFSQSPFLTGHTFSTYLPWECGMLDANYRRTSREETSFAVRCCWRRKGLVDQGRREEPTGRGISDNMDQTMYYIPRGDGEFCIATWIRVLTISCLSIVMQTCAEIKYTTGSRLHFHKVAAVFFRPWPSQLAYFT